MLFRGRRRPSAAVVGLPVHWSGWGSLSADREELAGEIEECEDFGVDPEGPGRFSIALFDDLRGLVGDDAVDVLERDLETLEGVDVVEREDREVIIVDGSLSCEQLRAFTVATLAREGDRHYWDERMA